MYSENLKNDALLIFKAVMTNQIARLAPGYYVKLTAQTGRGSDEGLSTDIADYFLACVTDYAREWGMDETSFGRFIQGKDVLEYGPGDILGVALICHAFGANTVHCVDRFPLNKISRKNAEVYRAIIEKLPAEFQQRARAAFNDPGQPESGFNADAIQYAVSSDGLSGKTARYDVIISRAVLEHVDQLDATFRDIRQALRPDGVSLHKIDLKSHGLDRYRPFDFLSWPTWLYRMMYSHKGFPNRWRADKYLQAAGAAGLKIKNLRPVETLDLETVNAIRPHLAPEFRELEPSLLSWQSFWLELVGNA